ncbi:MAG: hypothetical protein Q4A71_04570 [Actinomycetaceae bacterium]|nr:hypothetical protein [Actinomycetaceae bacterium]
MSEQPQLVKSKQRVADHGEVFTPEWMVRDMLDLVKDESERIDARVLEPACGEGAFLQEILRRKLTTVHARYSKNDFERRHYALLALMSTYTASSCLPTTPRSAGQTSSLSSRSSSVTTPMAHGKRQLALP